MTPRAVAGAVFCYTSLGQTETFTHSRWLTKQLETSPDVAVRRRTLAFRGWKLGSSAANALKAGSKSSVEARDIVPDLEQKGVDMRIGLDIASLALKRFVSTIVLVTGDADFIPAMKLARTRGVASAARPPWEACQLGASGA